MSDGNNCVENDALLGESCARSAAPQFVVKNSFLELAEERPAARWAALGRSKSESELPDLRGSLRLSDDDTDIESGLFLSDEDEERQSLNDAGSQAGSCNSERSKVKADIPVPPVCPSAFETLPALSAAAAAAAFDAAGLSPDFLQNLLQEQHRDQLPKETTTTAVPPSKPTGNGVPLVISVADALAPPVKPRDTRTTVMLRNLPNNYTRLMVVNLLNQDTPSVALSTFKKLEFES
eukprot:g17914.t1